MNTENKPRLSSAEMGITRRSATDADEGFLRAVYGSTRTEELAIVPWSDDQKASFLDMQFHAQHIFYHEHFADAAYDVLLQNDVAIGRLYVDRRPDEIRILDIALLPQYQNRGIGTSLVREVMDEAAEAGLKVSLHVETFNRAHTLYDRLGFVSVRTDGIYVLMEWKSDYASDT